MDYYLFKSLHMLSMVFLFGTGMGSAFYKLFTDRGGNITAIASTNRLVVIADWIFTTPAVIVQPVTGFALLHSLGISWTEPWVLAALGLYGLAGGCWLPVVALQIRMRRMSDQASAQGAPLPPQYAQDCRAWFWLGVPAFTSMVLIVLLMVFKPGF
ncbi:MAG: DUF2269 family protein [Magnetospiraceae bacterium]